MSIEIKYIPLSFINTDEEILKQIKNTILFSYLFQSFEETSLNYYLESTQYGYTASASDVGTHQLVRITDINSGKVDWNTVPFCECESEDKYLLKDDDILVARTGGTTGKSFIVKSAPKNSVFASYLIRLRLKRKVNLDFINLFLNSYVFWSQIIEMKSGSAMPNVNAEKLKTLKIPKVSFTEQNDFVNSFKNLEDNKNLSFVFDRINEIEKLFINSKEITTELNGQLDLIKQLRQSFLREAMQGKLIKSKHIEGQETGQQLLERIKTEKAKLISEKKLKKEKELAPITAVEIPFEIPKNWAWSKLGTICTKVTDGFHNTPKKLITGKIYISATHIKDTGIKWDECLYVGEKDHLELYKKARPQRGEILITNRGAGCGTPAIIDIDDEFSFQNTALIGFNQSLINNKYVHYFILKSRDEIMTKFVNGGLQPMLSNVILKTIPFPLPPFHEQDQIVAKLEELMKSCDSLEKCIRESEEYNDMLLQQILKEALQQKEEVVLDIDSLFEHHKNYDLYVAMIQTLIESQLGINHGEVANQKTIFHINTFTNEKIPYQFVNHNFGTFSQQLRDDFNRNPYLTKATKNNKEVFVIHLSKQKEVLDSIYKPENKNFVNAVKEILDIYELPFINKETDKIELLNTVSKVIQDYQSSDIEVVYQGMKNWKINQGDYKCKADKFSKNDAAKMIKLIENKGLDKRLIGL